MSQRATSQYNDIATCRRKVRHPTREQAEKALAQLRDTGRLTERECRQMHSYPCPCGPHWHVGKSWNFREKQAP